MWKIKVKFVVVVLKWIPPTPKTGGGGNAD